MIEFHADDYGLFEKQSELILNCMTDTGVLNGISIMPNSAYLDLCMKRLDLTGKQLNLTVHLNLVEGKCLSDEKDVPDLVNDGVFNISFGKLLAVSFVPFLRGRYKKQVKTELWNQISRALPYLDKYNIRLDSHCHYHMIPVVFDAMVEIIKENRLQVSYIRQPREKLGLLLSHMSAFEHFQFINLIKVLVLNVLYIINRIRHPKTMKNTHHLIFLGGVMFSGHMSLKNAEVLLPIARKYEQKGKNVEILFHPGGVFDPDDAKQLTDAGDKIFLLSNDRNIEADALRRLE